MRSTSDGSAWRRPRSLRARVPGAVVLAVVLTLCSSATGTASASTKSAIPSSAFSDHTGITAKTVSIGNVSTLAAGLFKGAAVGTQAYADYVNTLGGIYGRKILVDSSDDGYAGQPNKQQTQADIAKDVALVGGFSLYDNF